MNALTLTLNGPSAILEDLVPLFAAAHGWTPTHPQTAAEFARDVIELFLRESITAEAVKRAQATAAEFARDQARAAADALTLTLS